MQSNCCTHRGPKGTSADTLRAVAFLSMARSLVASLIPANIERLYKAVRPCIMDDKIASLQKRAYKVQKQPNPSPPLPLPRSDVDASSYAHAAVPHRAPGARIGLQPPWQLCLGAREAQ